MRGSWQVALLAASSSLSACARGTTTSAYTPATRDITITTVPLLVKELAKTYPFLAKDFAKGGVLDRKEVYAFSPSTITAIRGDTLRLHFINPEDDEHGFALRDLLVKLPPQSTVDTTYVARTAGVFPFSCTIPTHTPMMRGELVVLEMAGK
jgi:plastocyanin